MGAVTRRLPAAGALVLAGSFAAAGVAFAADTTGYQDLGTGAPPATVHGFGMEKMGNDSRADGTQVSSFTAHGDTLTFNHTVEKRTVPSSWQTWSHGYTGTVYWSHSGSVKITMPGHTKAFYVYVEPNVFNFFTVTVTASGGASATHSVHGSSGARGFAFYVENGGTIKDVTISCTDGTGFGFGEFGLHG